MLLTVDKIILLKSVDIFKEIPDQILADLASIVEDESYPEGTEIIKAGDMGNFMYIIQEGLVKVHKNETEFAQLQRNDIVGELSVLNPMPRSASVTTLTETFLLKITREPFLELLAQEVEVMKGVLRVLTERILGQNEKIRSLEAKLR